MLSVITPTLNARRFIESCLKVVIAQECPRAEHIIVDGGSCDGTVDIVRNYASRYPHIRWITEKDEGQSDAMNKGLALARGSVVTFLNVDDFYEPGVLNTVLAHFEKLPDPSLLVGNCNVWNDEGKLCHVNRPRRLKITRLVCGPYISPWPINPSQYFYHASLHALAGPYNVNEHYALDLDFILRAVQVAHVTYVDEIWGNYRFMEGTKTFTDARNGLNVKRYRAYLASYRKGLSPRQKCETAVILLSPSSVFWYLKGKKIAVFWYLKEKIAVALAMFPAPSWLKSFVKRKFKII